MGDVLIFIIGLGLGMFLGLLAASLCAVSKMADEEALDELNEEMIGNMEDDGK